MIAKNLVTLSLLAVCQAGHWYHDPAVSSTHIDFHGHGHPVTSFHAPAHHHVSHAAPEHHEEHHEYDHYVGEIAHPKYKYSYSVEDPHTGDHKSHHETRDGDTVKGEYSLLQPDGSFRKVTYTADHHSGFHAIVHNTPPVIHHHDHHH